MKINKQKGSVLKWFIIIVLVIVLISLFFDFSIQDAIENEQVQSNFDYIAEQLDILYNTYLSDKVNMLIDLIKNLFNNLKIGNTVNQ